MNTDLFTPIKDHTFCFQSIHPNYKKVMAKQYSYINQIPMNGTYKNGKKSKNEKKNLFGNIPCRDNSRVVLYETSDGADYINANYISGFQFRRKFIATEQPMASTLNNFWLMIWQENTRVIVMLNGSDEESEDSYPYISSSFDYMILGDFKIKQEEIKIKRDYIETVIIITNLWTEESRRVSHLKYLKWIKNKFPHENKILKFVVTINVKISKYFHEAEKNNQRMPGPIVIHGCSGTRRTTTLCAIDSCIYEVVNKERMISIPSVVLRIKQERNFSFPNFHYYAYVHKVLLYFLRHY